ncbi:MAG: sulfite exporter TauE/SafE family protein [Candidatus Thorarchaeota archaeon]
MQEVFIEFTLIVSLSILIGLGSSMVGISGGAFKTPLLIIIIGLSTQFSTAISLFSALFLAIPSSIEYNRNEKKPIMFKVGIIIALISIPGLYVGVILKSWIVDDYILRLIFGVCLFPVALMMLLTKRKPNGTDSLCNIAEYDINTNNSFRFVMAGLGFFVAGIAAGMLGIGGGTLYVPIMCLILGMPMLAAAATSVFAIIFTSTAGTFMNLMVIPQTSNIPLFLFYSSALGIGAILGGKIGADYACEIDGVILKRFFGAILVFPLVHLMNLGQMWFDPLGTNILISTAGDILIWILVVISCILVWIYWRRNKQNLAQSLDVEITESKGS